MGSSSSRITRALSLSSSSSSPLTETDAASQLDCGGRPHEVQHSEGTPTFASEQRQFGLKNLGNTCYSNSVLQVLFQCIPFRTRCIACLNYVRPDSLLAFLARLFIQLEECQKSKRQNQVNPAKFVHQLKTKSEIFRSPEHHDAHEFFSYLLNSIAEELTFCGHSNYSVNVAAKIPDSALTSLLQTPPLYSSRLECPASSTTCLSPAPLEAPLTWIHDLFQGILVYETRCLCCENVTRREEPFLDVPIECNYSTLEACLRDFAGTEYLTGKDKYLCDACGCLQDAERRLRFERLPSILTVHMKRFKFDEVFGRYCRVAKRVEFPVTLAFPFSTLSQNSVYLQPTAEPKGDPVRRYDEEAAGSQGNGSLKNAPDAPTPSCTAPTVAPMFDLFGVVVHIGTRISHGHYVSCVRSNSTWWLLDDHKAKVMQESDLRAFYGSSSPAGSFASDGAKCGYLLFYKSRSELPVHLLLPGRSSSGSQTSRQHQELIDAVRSALYERQKYASTQEARGPSPRSAGRTAASQDL